MKLPLFFLAALLPSVASAMTVEVQHEGFSKTYQVTPGTTIDDTWHDLGGRRSAWWHRTRKHDLVVHVEVSEVVEGVQQVGVRMFESRHGRVGTVFHFPAILVDASRQVGDVVVGGQVPGLSAAADGTVSVAYLNYTRTGIHVRPDAVSHGHGVADLGH